MDPTLKERTNFARISRVLTDLCTEVLRVILEKEINPIILKTAVTTQAITSPQKDKLRLFQNEKIKIDKAHTNGYKDFDLSLLYKLIKYLCKSIKPPTKGWYTDIRGNKPDSNDISVSDDIERIHLLRNNVYGHAPNTYISDTAFQTYWIELDRVMGRMAMCYGVPFDKNMNKMKNAPMDDVLMNKYIAAAEEQSRILDVVKGDVEDHEDRLTKTETDTKHVKFEIEKQKEIIDGVKGDVEDHEDRLTKTETDTKHVKFEIEKQKEIIDGVKGDVEDHEDRLTKTETDTKHVKFEIEKQKEIIDGVKGDVEDHEDRLTKTETDTKHVKFEIEKQKEIIDGVKGDVEDHEDRLTKTETDTKHVKFEIEKQKEIIDGVKGDVEDHEDRLTKTETDTKHVKFEIEKQKEIIDGVKGDVEDHEDRLTKTETDTKHVKFEIEKQKEIIDGVKGDVEDHEDRLTKTETDTKHVKFEIEKQKEIIDGVKGDVEDHEDRLTKTETDTKHVKFEIEKQKEIIDGVKGDVEDHEDRLTKTETDTKHVKFEIEKQKEIIDGVKGDVEDHEDRLTKTETDTKHVKFEIEKQKEIIDGVKGDVEDHEDRLTKTETDTKHVKFEIEKQKEIIDGVKGDVEDHEDRLTKTETDTKHVKFEIEKQKEIIDGVKGDVEDHEDRLTKTETDTKHVKFEIEKQKEIIDGVKGDVEDHEDRLTKTETDTKHVKFEIEKQKEIIDGVKGDVEDHEDRLTKTETDTKHVKFEIEKQKEIIDEVKGDVEDHEDRLTKTETDTKHVKFEIEKQKEIIDEVKDILFMRSPSEKDQERPQNINRRYSSALLSCYKESDKIFVETRAFKEAKKKMESNFYLMICGNPGDGKTSLAVHLSLKLVKDGYCFRELNNTEGLTHLLNDCGKIVVVIDDIFGVTIFDRYKTEMVSRILTPNKICQLNKMQGQIMIIMTSRKSIMKKAMNVLKHKDLFESPQIVDLSNPGYNVCEKQRILSAHLKHCNLENSEYLMDDFVQRVSNCNGPHGFPHCAKMFSSSDKIRNRGIAFFESPLEYIAKDVERIKYDDPMAYAILCMLMIRKGKIRQNDLEEYYKITDLAEIADRLCLERKIDVKQHFETIKDLYTRSDNAGEILFRHESIFETVCVVCGEKFQNEVISLLPFVYVKKLVTTIKSQGLKLYIEDEKHKTKMVLRFWKEISFGNIKEVCEHPSCSDKYFVEKLFLSSLNEEIKTECGLYPQSMLLLTDTGINRYKDAFGFNGTLLYWSAVSNRESLCRKILRSRLFDSSDRFWYCNQLTATLLHACYNGFDLSIIKDLLDLGASANCKMDLNDTLYNATCPCDNCLIHKSGTTPLHALMLCDIRKRKQNKDFTEDEIIDKFTEEKVQILLRYQSDINATDKNGYDPVWYAVVANNLVVTKTLITFGASTTKLYPVFRRNLISVAKSKQMVDILTSHGTDISLQDSLGLSLLHSSESADVISHLLRHLPVNIKDKQGRTPLHTASKANVVQTLIEHGADVNATDNEGKTPLHVASNIEVMQTLIKFRAKINAVDKYCKTPLYYFIDAKNTCKELIKAGADVNTSQAEGSHLLMCVKNSDVLRTLVKKGAKANTKKYQHASKGINMLIEACFPKKTSTALLVHAEEGTLNPEILEILLNAGDDIHIVNAKGRNLIHCVVSSATSDEKCVTIVENLLLHGVSSNKLDNDGCTPLQLAINGNIKLKRTILLLLEFQKRTSFVDPNLIHVLLNSKTSSICSHFSFFVDILQQLLTYSSFKNSRSSCGDTIIHQALQTDLDEEKIFKTVKLMLEFGCDPTIRNNDMETPLKIALYKDFKVVTLLLLRNGGFDDTALDEMVSVCSSNSDPLLSQCIIKELDRMEAEKLIQLKKDVKTDINKHVIENTEMMELIHTLLKSYESDDVVRHVVEILITPENVNFVNSAEETFLMKALCATQKRHKVITYLLSKGADTNLTDKCGKNILHYLFERRVFSEKYIPSLINHGLILQGKTAIVLSSYSAIHSQSLIEVIALFLEHGADINETIHGKNALYNILTQRNGEECIMLIRFLIDNGFDINHRIKQGIYPIHAALESRVDIEVVEELINLGVDLDARDFIGRTAIHLASKYCDFKTLESVINAGADINAECEQGRNGLHYLIENSGNDRHGMLALLLQGGININKKSYSGDTALDIALHSEHEESILIGQTSLIRHMLLRHAGLLSEKYTTQFVLRNFEKKIEKAEVFAKKMDHHYNKDALNKVELQCIHELLHITSLIFSNDRGRFGVLPNAVSKTRIESCFLQLKSIYYIKDAIRHELKILELKTPDKGKAETKEPVDEKPMKERKKNKKCLIS